MSLRPGALLGTLTALLASCGGPPALEPEHAVNPATGTPIPVRPWTSPVYFHGVAFLFERSAPDANEAAMVEAASDAIRFDARRRIRYRFGEFSLGDRDLQLETGARVRVYAVPPPGATWICVKDGLEIRWRADGERFPVEVREGPVRRFFIGASTVVLGGGTVTVEDDAGRAILTTPVWIQLGPDGRLLGRRGRRS